MPEEVYAKASRADETVVKSFKESIRNISRPTPLRTDDLLRDMARLFTRYSFYYDRFSEDPCLFRGWKLEFGKDF